MQVSSGESGGHDPIDQSRYGFEPGSIQEIMEKAGFSQETIITLQEDNPSETTRRLLGVKFWAVEERLNTMTADVSSGEIKQSLQYLKDPTKAMTDPCPYMLFIPEQKKEESNGTSS